MHLYISFLRRIALWLMELTPFLLILFVGMPAAATILRLFVGPPE